MLYLITGLPGDGKTLYAVSTLDARAKAENRAVYYHDIAELTLGWLQLPMKRSTFTDKEVAKGAPEEIPDWQAVPKGSIVLIDEAHKIFPSKGHGTRELYVQYLKEHRHDGLDIYLLTQFPTATDSEVRKLAGKHFHLVRRFGTGSATLWQWERAADPSSSKDKKEGQHKKWKHSVAYYGTYKSADIHTHKADLPWRKIMLAVVAAIVAVLSITFFIHNFFNQGKSKRVPSSGGEGAAVSVRDGGKPLVDAGGAYWASGRVERVSGVPQSAPIYDAVQKVQTQPRIEGCMMLTVKSKVQCTCSGPNSARLEVTSQQCAEYVKRGWFDETRKYDDVKARNIEFLNERSGHTVDAVISSSPITNVPEAATKPGG